MTSSVGEMAAVLAGGTLAGGQTASAQTSVPAEKLLNSASAGFLIHRVGQLHQSVIEEALQFSNDLVELINTSQVGYVSIFTYRELFGSVDRLHWFLHLKQPNDYARLLEMVDHSRKWREVSEGDRLPTKGGGNWERMFLEGSMTETIICPQHGVSAHDEDHSDLDTFQPPARYQNTLKPEQLLTSVNSPVTVHRRFQVRYAYREEARQFWFGWARFITERFPGRATAFLYEEMWGQQDRLHLLLHLSSIQMYEELSQLALHDEEFRALLQAPVISADKGGGLWPDVVIDGSMTDTLLVPAPGRVPA